MDTDELTGKNINRRPRGRGLWLLLAMAVVIIFAAGIRLRLLDTPLERDEGEYAYAGRLILQGHAPYLHVYSMKMPGIFAVYAIILAVFGQTPAAIHLGLLLVNSAAIVLVFLLARRLYDSTAGVVAAAAFAVLSLSRYVQGLFANAEHFVILPVLAAFLLLLAAVERQKWYKFFIAGVLLGLAFVIKQHGAAFTLFALLYIGCCCIRRRPFLWKNSALNMLLFLVGCIIPVAITVLVLWRTQALAGFWFWTFEYARQHLTVPSLLGGPGRLASQAKQFGHSATWLCLLMVVGLSSLWWNKKAVRNVMFTAGFSVFSFLAVCPGFHFRPHYFVLLLPAAAVLAGIGAAAIIDVFARQKSGIISKLLPIILVVGSLFHAFSTQGHYLLMLDAVDVCRATYPLQLFPETLRVGRFIKEHSKRDDLIAVVGSEPQIYFYADRRSATGYIYMYPLMEPHPYARQMQEEMIAEIETASPEFLVVVYNPVSWMVRPESEKMILSWAHDYPQKFYRMTGIIDVAADDSVSYVWDDAASDYRPRGDRYIFIYQRRRDNSN